MNVNFFSELQSLFGHRNAFGNRFDFALEINAWLVCFIIIIIAEVWRRHGQSIANCGCWLIREIFHFECFACCATIVRIHCEEFFGQHEQIIAGCGEHVFERCARKHFKLDVIWQLRDIWPENRIKYKLFTLSIDTH